MRRRWRVAESNDSRVLDSHSLNCTKVERLSNQIVASRLMLRGAHFQQRLRERFDSGSCYRYIRQTYLRPNEINSLSLTVELKLRRGLKRVVRMFLLHLGLTPLHPRA